MSSVLERFDNLASAIEYFRDPTRIVRVSDMAHLATAYGLAGELSLAKEMFVAALAARDTVSTNIAESLSYLVDARDAASDQSTFNGWAERTINGTRAALKLPARDHIVARI